MLIQPMQLIPYFPDACLNDLELKVTQAQNLIESHLVANRSFEIQKYTELKTLSSKSGNLLLLYNPITTDETNYPITVQIRQPGYDWVALNSTEYSIDSDLDELKINSIWFGNFTQRYFSAYGRGTYYGSWNTRPNRSSRRERQTELKITYYSGFDLENASSTDNVATKLQSSFINLIQQLASETNSGLKKFVLTEHYEVEYFNGNDKDSLKNAMGEGSNLSNLIAYFKSFKARTFNH